MWSLILPKLADGFYEKSVLFVQWEDPVFRLAGLVDRNFIFLRLLC
jgi:hypothetical protein